MVILILVGFIESILAGLYGQFGVGGGQIGQIKAGGSFGGHRSPEFCEVQMSLKFSENSSEMRSARGVHLRCFRCSNVSISLKPKFSSPDNSRN